MKSWEEIRKKKRNNDYQLVVEIVGEHNLISTELVSKVVREKRTDNYKIQQILSDIIEEREAFEAKRKRKRTMAQQLHHSTTKA